MLNRQNNVYIGRQGALHLARYIQTRINACTLVLSYNKQSQIALHLRVIKLSYWHASQTFPYKNSIRISYAESATIVLNTILSYTVYTHTNVMFTNSSSSWTSTDAIHKAESILVHHPFIHHHWTTIRKHNAQQNLFLAWWRRLEQLLAHSVLATWYTYCSSDCPQVLHNSCDRLGLSLSLA